MKNSGKRVSPRIMQFVFFVSTPPNYSSCLVLARLCFPSHTPHRQGYEYLTGPSAVVCISALICVRDGGVMGQMQSSEQPQCMDSDPA